MTTEYTMFQCACCDRALTASEKHKCPEIEKQMREIAREEILNQRAPVTYPMLYEALHKRMERLIAPKEAIDSIKQLSRDEALEEAARVCGGEDNHVYLPEYWNAMKDMACEIRSLKSQPAQPSAEKPAPPPEPCVWMTAKRRKKLLGFEKERDDLYEKLAEANEDRNRLLQMLKDEQQSVRDLKDGRAAAEKALDEIANHMDDVLHAHRAVPWISEVFGVQAILKRTGRLS